MSGAADSCNTRLITAGAAKKPEAAVCRNARRFIRLMMGREA